MRALLIVSATAFAATLVVLALTIASAPQPRGPFATPLSEAGAFSGPGSTQQRIARLQALVRAQPANATALVSLGSALLQRVRETGDLSYYERAQQAIADALAHDPANAAAFITRGVLRLARHDFSGALRDGLHARELAPHVVKALGVIVDANVELGRYPAAATTLQRMIDAKPNLDSYARVSYFRELHGDLRGARQALSLALSASGEAAENVAYVQALQGRLEFLSGRLSAARRAYRLALARQPRYPLAMVGLAEVDSADGRLPAAISRLRAAVQQLPLPVYITQLGEAELAAGQPRRARRDFELIGAEQRLLRASKVNTDAELALYEASDGSPLRAVALARRAWSQAPSVRSADALGWALTRADQPRQGLRWARRALRLGSVEPSFLYHAAMAAVGSGRRDLARTWLTRALARTPRFSPLFGPRAQRALRALR